MGELILHEFAASPFSEKVRLIFGFKGLQWRSVEIPVVMPKPDVVALTGGYRRTPFLQIGADVFCDSALVAKVLDRLHADPTLYPASAPLAEQVAQWADFQFFWVAVAWSAQPAAAAAHFPGTTLDELKAFAADRAAFTAGMARPRAADAKVQLLRDLRAFEAQLADGRPFLLGAQASIADFAVAHGLWFVRRGVPVAGVLSPFGRVNAWLDRVIAFGHGRSDPITSAEALRIAAAAPGHAVAAVEPGMGFDAGASVTVAATDYGTDPVAGTLVGLNEDEVVLRRNDPRAGTVHVHFPRAGFQIKQEKA
jgi:glutathione S-transferase